MKCSLNVMCDTIKYKIQSNGLPDTGCGSKVLTSSDTQGQKIGVGESQDGRKKEKNRKVK